MPLSQQAASDDITSVIRPCIQKVATGPEMSKDLTQEEAQAAMQMIMEGQVDPVQSAVLLIALRMKREAMDEYRGILQAIRDNTTTATAEVDELMDVADPYDGYARGLPATPFLPAVLAACGLPAVCHGVQAMGPKYGATNRMILREAGVQVDLTAQQAAERIANPDIGWAYVDMEAFCPGLHALTPLRSLIVKRTCLTTVENLVGPVRAKKKTHLLIGFVHKAYPPIYAELARFSGFDSGLVVRGVEGGVTPSLQQTGRLFQYKDMGPEQEVQMEPAELGIESDGRAVPLPESLTPGKLKGKNQETVDSAALASAAAAAGLAALEGAKGPTRESLAYSGALCLWHLGREPDLKSAADRIRRALDDGSARRRFFA
jgi:anthranilate phosphoribosyltransferase